MPFSVSCDIWHKGKFRTQTALQKHLLVKHDVVRSTPPDCLRDENGITLADLPHPRRLEKVEVPPYLEWLTGIVERMNGTLHPLLKGNRFCLK